MNYRVVIQPRAQRDIDDAFRWVQQQAPERAARWYNALVAAIDSLQTLPARCGLAPEADIFEKEIRQLLHGKRRGVYRILFTIEGDIVSVLAVRHAARSFL